MTHNERVRMYGRCDCLCHDGQRELCDCRCPLRRTTYTYDPCKSPWAPKGPATSSQAGLASIREGLDS